MTEIITSEFTNKAGIERITIPYSEDELDLKTVEKVLPEVIAIHNRNKAKIKKYLEYVDGTKQDIDDKERKYEKQKGHNNKIKDNHAYAWVNFKEGFLLGEKREFTQKADTNSDDLVYFDRYLTGVGFYGKDVDVKHNIYATGIGIDFVQPRKDILIDVGNNQSRYKTVDEGYDIDNDSPFVYDSLDCRNNGIVYTNKIGAYGLGDLFDFSINKEYDDKGNLVDYITVYTRQFTAKFGMDFKVKGKVIETPPNYKELPMTAHSINKANVGIIEIGYDVLNALNTIISNSLDNIVDRVNQVLVFKNCDFGDNDLKTAENISKMLESGAIILPNNALQPSSVDTISIDLKLSEVNVIYEEILTRAYDKVGVPLPSASVTSGGDTGQARLLGSGWTNAYSVIQRDILYMEQGDRETLRKMLKVCKLNPKNKVNEISANQIDIKYGVTLSDNILVKSQAMQTMYSINVPKQHILKAIPMWNDSKTVAQDWEKYDKEVKDSNNQENTQKNQEDNQVNTSEDILNSNLDNKVKS